jgi:hypothetical protein
VPALNILNVDRSAQQACPDHRHITDERTFLSSACMSVKLFPADRVESAWGAVPALLLVRFPRPLAEPAVRLSPQRALRGFCRGLVQAAWAQGLGILLPR